MEEQYEPYETEEETVEDLSLEKYSCRGNRGHRRAVDISKAKSRRAKDRSKTGSLRYDNLHAYSKGKIHCSCWMCSFHGPTMQDMKTGVALAQRYAEYLAG